MCPESEPAAASPFPVLIVDDDPVQCRLLESYVQRMGGRATAVPGVAEARRALGATREPPFSAVILDLMMPDGSGLEVLAHLRAAGAGVPVIVQTARAGLDTVVSAMRAGAFDFIVKPASPDKIRLAIEAALRAGRAAEASVLADPSPAPRGRDPMAAALSAAARAARSTIPVILLGETGVGKEWLARRIVEAGPRARAPFVAVNCGALPKDLVESILFGHERGAFTGAAQRHPGKFLEADGGTLFLDEVAELAPEAQVKLLRALQEGEIDPVGSASPVRTDVRIVAATHRDLRADVASGRFREDLFYRLHVFPIAIPPLRERRGEIGPLAEGFLARFSGAGRRRLSAEALRFLEAQDWPGNIRELENAVHRALVLSDDPVLPPDAFEGPGFPASVFSGDGVLSTEPGREAFRAADRPAQEPPSRFLGADGEVVSLEAMERALIAFAVERYDGRLAAVARHLRIGRSTLYRKMREYGIARGE